MMRKKLLIIIGIVYSHMMFSQELSDKQKSVIYNEAIKTLQLYQGYINQIADEIVDINQANKASEKLIELFVSRKALIYNDLDPSHQLSEFYELETYVSNLLLWYPDGMKITVDFDNIKAGNIISLGNDIFTVDLMTTKKIAGNYLNKQKNNNEEELLFRLAFYQKGNVFENYKIAGIRTRTSKTKTDNSNMIAEVKNAAFNETEMQKVKEQIKSTLNDYVNFLNLLADPKEAAEDKVFYKTSFLGLFKDDKTNLANDIEPEPQKRWLVVGDYLENYQQSYPEGIRNLGINVDSAEYGKVIPEGKEKFYLHVYADKFFSGKYKEKEVFRDNPRLDFKIVFDRDENTYKNFRIESIEKYGVNYYEQTTETATVEVPQQKISVLKRDGIYFGLASSIDLSGFSDPNLTDAGILKWNVNGKMGLKLGATVKYYPLNFLGIESGVIFNSYAVKARLSGNFRSTEYSTDVNNEQYLKIVNAAYDSVISFSYISIPINFVFHSNKKTEKAGLFVKAGLVTSILMNSKYKASGSFSTAGYYEQNPKVMQTLSNPELGFQNRSGINTSGDLKVKKLHFSMITAIGVTLPLNYYTSLEFGPEILWGISSVSEQGVFVDAFGFNSSAKSVSIAKYGFKFGIHHKF